MSSWLSRQFGIGKVKTQASDDIMSAAFGITGSSHSLITTPTSAMEKCVWVYRAVSTVATRIGSLPWNLYKGDKVQEGQRSYLLRPNPGQTWTEVLERVVAWQLLKGFGCFYVEPLNLRALDAGSLRNDNGSLQAFENGQWKSIDPKRLVVFPNLSLTGMSGLSELSTILDAANMSENAKAVWNNQMGSGGVLSGLLSTDTRLSEQELTAIKSKWEERYGGISKAGTMAFLGAGFKFSQMGINAADMRMLEVSSVTKNEIGTAFGVPGIFLGDMESVDYSNAQIQERILYSNTVCPKADRLAERITLFLLPLLGLKGLEFRFDYSGIEALQANKLERAQIDEIQIRSGVLTINEVCKRDNLDTKKWGDAWWTSAMNTPITSAEIEKPEPVPPALPPEAVPSPVDEGKGIKAKSHSPEARSLIAKAFIAKTAPQERKFASATMKTFNKQAKEVVTWVENGAKAEPVKVVRELLSDADLVENWHSLFVAFGMQAAEEVAARYDMVVPDGSAILKWIRKQESKQSTLVNDTTADEVSKILADLRAEGASIPDMVKATKGYFEGIAYRAERVARTNVIACNNAAAQETYLENGVKQHEWLSTQDDATRNPDKGDEYDHVSANGEVVGINEPFMKSGAPLMYPGDPEGDAANVINCRCTILPVI
jgi:HK97 family phage portal protein